MKTCPKCGKSLSESSFYRRSNRPGKVQPYCKSCWNLYCSERQRKQKEDAVQRMGGKCTRCGYNKCISALEFHHLDPNTKDIDISSTRLGKKKMKEELDKCVLVCSNCHRELHSC